MMSQPVFCVLLIEDNPGDATLVKDMLASAAIRRMHWWQYPTQQTAAQREPHSTLERYRSVVECANDAIFLGDADTGTILDANPQAERLLGLPKDQIIGMHQSQLHPPVSHALAVDDFRRAVAGTRPTNAEDIEVQASDSR
jgi:PAS domain S-box-containing protein